MQPPGAGSRRRPVKLQRRETTLAADAANVNARPSYRDAPVTSSSTRSFTSDQVTSRSYSQPGEALEITPGLIVSQHSGAGKANQYFLRGFALDHGYDIGLTIDGMPINQGSHVHSNGYADANFIIPELFSSMDVRKGPYFADEGQFSSVGAIHMQYLNSARQGLGHRNGRQLRLWPNARDQILGAGRGRIAHCARAQ